MSARQAAEALLELDAELSAFAAGLDGCRFTEKREVVKSFIRESVMNTWTLTLAARVAGVTEQQVVAALLHLEPLRAGSTYICRTDAAELFEA
ncbi:hypothetical protein [Paraburkholderia youngii]|uniref:hypothetical protein n=1 Tax=Paraburkholderia youngii TaxID=2782701 RepID=UPI003D25BFF6